MEKDMSRRAFVGTLGTIAAAGVAATSAFASEKQDAQQASSQVDEAASAEEESSGWLTEDPQRYSDRGGTTLTLEELNTIRHNLVDAVEEVTASDGTTLGVPWSKLAVLTNTYGGGLLKSEDGDINSAQMGDLAEYLKDLFDDDEEGAEHYLEMPQGKVFSVYEYAEESGRTVEECAEICASLASRALLCHMKHSNGDYYHQLPLVHGFYEYSIAHLYEPEGTQMWMDKMASASGGFLTSGTTLYYSIPCDKSIVSDERILPLNDYETFLERYDTICLLPCVCSLPHNIAAGVDVPPMGSEELKEFRNVFENSAPDGEGHHLERCFAFGEEAEYYLECGLGRQVTKDEARAVFERNIDEGLVLQMGYTRNSEIICSCHSTCCGVLGAYTALGPDVFPNLPISTNCSTYLLDYDRDACIQCGACIDRCPMYAISMDETNHPQVNGMCVRCGQCGLVCPVHARTLHVRPAEDRLPIPDDHMDDHNRKFGFRVEHDLI